MSPELLEAEDGLVRAFPQAVQGVSFEGIAGAAVLAPGERIVAVEPDLHAGAPGADASTELHAEGGGKRNRSVVGRVVVR